MTTQAHLPIGKLDHALIVRSQPLHGAVRKNALFLAVGKDVFHCRIWKHNLLCAVGIMPLDLPVAKL